PSSRPAPGLRPRGASVPGAAAGPDRDASGVDRTVRPPAESAVDRARRGSATAQRDAHLRCPLVAGDLGPTTHDARRQRVRIEADRNVCIGAGQCVMVAPEVFDQGEEDGLVEVLDTAPPKDRAAVVREAELLCPSGAITVHED